MINEKEFQNISYQVSEVIRYSQNIENPKISPLMNKWAENKADIIKLFGNKTIYRTNEKITIDLEPDEKEEKFFNFLDKIKDSCFNYYGLEDFILANRENFFSNVTESDFEFRNIKIPKGIKISKAFKFFIDDLDDLDRVQTIASRLIQENKLSGYLYLSVHPLDYLSSSENNNKWRSCHALDGEYRAGNLSYMCDNSTIVCYIADEKLEKLPHFPESILWNSKKWRMLLFLSDTRTAMFAGRHYPFFSEKIMEEIRFRISRILKPDTDGFTFYFGSSKKEWSNWHNDYFENFEYTNKKDESNFWKKYVPIAHHIYDIEQLIEDKSDLHFNDLLRSSVYTPYYAWIKTEGDPIHFSIGSKIPCLRCGKYDITDSETMVCTDCDDENSVFCVDCAERVHIDDTVYVPGHGYICSRCFDDSYAFCALCGEPFHVDDMIYDDSMGEWICIDCNEERNVI